MNGKRIKQLRKEVGLTQAELGMKLGVVKQTISSWENNISEPNGDTLIQLSKTLGTSPDYLLGGNPTIPDKETYRSEKNKTTIKYWVEKTGEHYSALAKKLGITEELFMDYLNNRLDIPYSILNSLSIICEVSTDCLLGMIDKSRDKGIDNVPPFQYNYKIAGRIQKLCEEKGTNLSFLEKLLSLSDKEIFYLIEYGFVPHVDTIIKLAKHFEVSTDYLLCLIDERDEKVSRTFRKLNDDNKDIIIGDIKKYLKEQRYETIALDQALSEAK